MDNALLGVVLAVVGCVLIAVAAWFVSQYKNRRLALEAAQWIPVQAMIESGALEGIHESGRVVLPTFAFSYKVSDQYYSGRFSLRTNLPGELAGSMIGKMVGRTILVRYDPKKPEAWFIPDKLIDGYSVEQKLGSHVIHDYSPKD
jgi:Protein of unknown function (DUF3592)